MDAALRRYLGGVVRGWEGYQRPDVNRVPRWRIAAAVAVLAALLGFAALFTPIYIHNIELQSYVADLTRGAEAAREPDSSLREKVLKKAKKPLANSLGIKKKPSLV